MSNQLHDQIVQYMMKRFYGNPIIANVWRGDYVENMIYFALENQWELESEWNGWDLQNEAGVRLEVKQSAARQTWTAPGKSATPSFSSVAPKTGYSTTGADWIELPGRYADIYIFAYHSETDSSIADHRRSDQWRFYVVPESKLPERQKTIGLNHVKRLSEEFTYEQLPYAIYKATRALSSLKANVFPSQEGP